MFVDAIFKIYSEIWPMLLIFCVVIVSLRIADILKNKKEINLCKEIGNIIFTIYIMFLFEIVTFQDVSWSTANFIPFKEMFRYVIGSKLFIRNVIGNMFLFLPYGFLVSYSLRLKKPYILLLLTIIVSLTIETTQLLIGRVFDIDDIFLNIVGSLFGFFIYRIIAKIIESLKKKWWKHE